MKFPLPHTPLPDSVDANALGCKCSRELNKSGEGIVITDEPGLPVRQFVINPLCELHSNTKSWLPPPLAGSGD